MQASRSRFWQLCDEIQARHAAGDLEAATTALRQAQRIARMLDTPAGPADGARRTRMLEMLAATLERGSAPPPLHLSENTSSAAPPPHAAPAIPGAAPVAPEPPPEAQAPAPVPARRILVSGIGRSGTTLLYQQIAKLLLLEDLRVNFRYEPYLWNIKNPTAKGNPFDMGQLHPYGIHVHTTCPLVLGEGADDPLHDAFTDRLFAAPWDKSDTSAATPVPADAYLTKVIRGTGRLRAMLARYPDLRIVANLRNPLDTLNSSLGMFSFLGEEFHADDRPRLAAELAARGMEVPPQEAGARAIEWAAAWWRLFTQETLALARDYPENVLLFCYEAFAEAPAPALAEVKAFLGLDNLGMELGLSRPAGPRIASTSLTRHDLGVLAPDFEAYTRDVMAPRLGPEASAARAERIVRRYTGGRFSVPLAGSRLGTRAPIQLRGDILSQRPDPFARFVARRAHPLAPETLALPAEATVLYDPKSPHVLCAGQGDLRFGAVITCHNNAATIADAVLSCLNQTQPFDHILVVEDKSTDSSRAVIRELEAMYSNVTMLALNTNAGPSLARHLGMRALGRDRGIDYVTQLDGDDLFWPTKLEAEAAVIAGQRGVVAFSDIFVVTPEGRRIQNTTAHGQGDAFATLLARTPQIPRDMTLDYALYTGAGGYNMLLDLYEDWEFKLRLAAGPGRWLRAAGGPGTVYNRLSPGLSGKHDSAHARALSMIFLGAQALKLPESPNSENPSRDNPSHENPGAEHSSLESHGAAALLKAFDAALGRFGDRAITRAARQALERAAPHAGARRALARLATSRAAHRQDNIALADMLSSFDPGSDALVDTPTAPRADTPTAPRTDAPTPGVPA